VVAKTNIRNKYNDIKLYSSSVVTNSNRNIDTCFRLVGQSTDAGCKGKGRRILVYIVRSNRRCHHLLTTSSWCQKRSTVIYWSYKQTWGRSDTTQ